MRTKKIFYLLSISILLVSFTIPAKPTTPSITITKSSEALAVSEFLLTEGNVVLKSGSDFTLYVKIKTKKIKGKKRNENFEKEQRNGVQYNVIYTYKYVPSGKKTHYIHKYILWDDGELFNWKPSENITVGKITLKTEVNEYKN